MKAKMEVANTRKQKWASPRVYNMKKKKGDDRRRIYDITREAENATEKGDMKKVYDTTRLLSGKRTIQIYTSQETETGQHQRTRRDLTEGPILAIRTGKIIMSEIKKA